MPATHEPTNRQSDVASDVASAPLNVACYVLEEKGFTAPVFDMSQEVNDNMMMGDACEKEDMPVDDWYDKADNTPLPPLDTENNTPSMIEAEKIASSSFKDDYDCAKSLEPVIQMEDTHFACFMCLPITIGTLSKRALSLYANHVASLVHLLFQDLEKEWGYPQAAF